MIESKSGAKTPAPLREPVDLAKCVPPGGLPWDTGRQGEPRPVSNPLRVGGHEQDLVRQVCRVAVWYSGGRQRRVNQLTRLYAGKIEEHGGTRTYGYDYFDTKISGGAVWWEIGGVMWP